MKTKTKTKPFGGMTPAKRRVAIAKDVLKQLDAKRLIATNAVYLDPINRRSLLKNSDKGRPLRPILKTRLRKCEVCALGAVFVAGVERFNQCNIPNHLMWAGNPSDSFMRTSLTPHFSMEQLALIEMFFESRGDLSGTTKDRFATAYPKWVESDQRLRAIMRNIIANKGTFKPENDKWLPVASAAMPSPKRRAGNDLATPPDRDGLLLD